MPLWLTGLSASRLPRRTASTRAAPNYRGNAECEIHPGDVECEPGLFSGKRETATDKIEMKRNLYSPLLAASLAIAIFIADTLTHTEIAFAVLYVVVVLMSVGFFHRRRVMLVSAACLALTVISYVLTPGGYHSTGLVNLMISLTAIGATTFLVLRIESVDPVLRKRDALIRRLVDANIIGIIIWDLESQILEANDAFLRLVGLDRDDLTLGRVHWTDLTPAEWRDRTARAHAELKTTGTIQPYEKEYFRKDGSRVPVLIGAATFEEAENQAVAFVIDLTERKRAEQALHEREAKIRGLFDANIIAIFIGNIEGQIIEANDAFFQMLGYDREDVASGRVHRTKMTPPEWRDRDARTRAALETSGTVQPFEKEYLRKDGSRIPVLIGAAVFAPDRVVAFVLDLSERKRAEGELQASEELKRRIIESSTDCIKVLDLDGNLLFMSSGGQRLLEIDNIQDYLNSCWIDFWQPENRPKIREAVTAASAGGIGKFQAFCPSAKGAQRWWDVVITPICNADGQPEQLLAVSRDITDRRRAEEALRESEEQWKAVFENNPTMYFMVDTNGAIVSVNPLGAEQLGFTVQELIGSPVRNLFHAEDREAVARNAAICFKQPGQTMSWEARKIRKNGEVLWVREMARVMLIKDRPAALVVCEDITERKRVSEALREVQLELAHANRASIIGQLTASIAHEVNQPISAMVTNAEAALRWLSAQPPNLQEVERTLGRIVKDGNRAANVIARIRDLIKKAPPRKDSLDMNGAIRETIELTRGETEKNGVVVRTQLADGLPLVQGDRVQLQQVMLNLIINAVEAMTGAGEGKRELLISTGKASSEDVLVSVRDSGPGLTPASLDRLFDAFYTTKSTGLGLGLSICRSAIGAWRPAMGKCK